MIELRVPLYMSRVFCFFSTDDFIRYKENIRNVFADWFDDTTTQDKFDNDVRTGYVLDALVGTDRGKMYHVEGLFFIMIHDYKDEDFAWRGVFSHEVAHVAFEILRRVGLKESVESTEAYTYLIGYLTEQLLHGEKNNPEGNVFK